MLFKDVHPNGFDIKFRYDGNLSQTLRNKFLHKMEYVW